jgi:hypothetical protein
MATFFGLLSADDKQGGLQHEISNFRAGTTGYNTFERLIDSFSAIDDAAFLYSMPGPLLDLAARRQVLSKLGADARQGIGAASRFHRLWWEILPETINRDGSKSWPLMAHGTPYAPFYKPSYFRFKWGNNGAEAKADVCHRYPYLNGNYGFKIQAEEHYFLPGLSYGKRTTNFSVQVLPADHVFSFEGTAIAITQSAIDPWSLLGLLNSRPVSFWLARVCAQHKAYNYLQNLPVPLSIDTELGGLAKSGWKASRQLDTVNEVSNAFLLPVALRARVGEYDPAELASLLSAIQSQIDEIAFDLYCFSDADRAAALGFLSSTEEHADDGAEDEDDSEEVDSAEAIDPTDGLLSWAAGVAFGRFDWRLATGEREAPPEPDPFEPLPAKSPGMLPDGDAPFYAHSGMLVDDQGHPNDLARLIEEVLVSVEAPVPGDVRRWLLRDFFSLHLKQYSKSRRKAPIYWPLSTTSGSYTLWLYYPSLTSSTLYSAINDFVEPKLGQVSRDIVTLRDKGAARSRDEEKTFEALQTLELELIELRDALLQIAPTYSPNHDDGVQVTAAPLWQLFRHKTWQKTQKDTWAKLEKGEYDWSHLAMAYWPDRVREKCKSDKSLAIAHDLEELYIEPKPRSPKPAKLSKGAE